MQDAAFNDGANVQQWSYGGGSNQQWELVSDNGGNFYIKNRNSGLFLDVAWGLQPGRRQHTTSEL